MKLAMVAVLGLLVATLAGCGTSNASVDRNRNTGVSDSGYPPKAQGVDPGSPAISSAGPKKKE